MPEPSYPCTYCGEILPFHRGSCPVVRPPLAGESREERLERLLKDLVEEVGRGETWLRHTATFDAAAKEVGYEVAW